MALLMSLWAEACVICRRGTPNDILAELDTSWVTVNEDAPMRGHACLVFRRHAVELHDLSAGEGPHGNTIAHLDMHFLPRIPMTLSRARGCVGATRAAVALTLFEAP